MVRKVKKESNNDMSITKSLLVYCALLGGIYQLHAQTDNPYSTEVQQKIQQVENELKSAYGDESQSISNQMQAYKLKGLSIAVIDNFEVVWAKAYGISESENNTAATTKTVFQAGSMSKTVNALALLKWAEDKGVDLDADVNSMLKSWQVPNKNNRADRVVTLRMLLSHTAGLSVHGFGGYRKPDNLPSVLQILKGEKPANSRPVIPTILPNIEILYSGGGTTLSQLILMENTGVSYEQYVRQNILTPLGLANAFYSVELDQYGQQEVAHAHVKNGKPIKNLYNFYPESAAAGLWTNPTDLATILIDLQESLRGHKAQVLSQSAAQEMITPPLSDGLTALGIFAYKKGDETYLYHSGSTRGFLGEYIISSTTGQGLVVMINGEDSRIIEEIKKSVAQAYQWPGFEPKEKADISFSDNDIQAYSGTYQFKKRQVTVRYEKEAFSISEKGKWSGELIPLSRTSFVVEGINPETTIEFETNEDGVVTEIKATQGATITWSKVEK